MQHLVAAALVAVPLTCVSFLPAMAQDAPEPASSLEDELAHLAKDRLFKDAKVAVQVVNVRTGEEVFGRDADVALNPASTMKVLTSAAALDALGASYHFTTGLYSDGELDSAGVLRGNLYVKGGGDPTLVIERLWKMVYDLKLDGVERVAGDVIYDESFLSTDYVLPGWGKKEDIERGPSYYPPIGALSLNFNTVSIVVAPGEEVGSPARVQLETPAGGYITLESEVTTGAVRSWRTLEIERTINDDKTMTFALEGSVPHGDEARRYYRSVDDPTAHFMAAFTGLLDVHGVGVSGRHRRGSTPEAAESLLVLRSPPLASILMDTNKYSNNFMAELVLRVMGAEVHGIPGTNDTGLQVISDYMVSIGIEEGSFTLINGSGLSRKSFISPRHLTTVMVDMAADRRVGHEFVSSLSIAGQDGTLWRRLRDHQGELRGKTGTIDGIHCLTGFVEGGDGELYAFGFLVNDVRGSISKVKRLHDQFAQDIFDLDAPQLQVVDEDTD